MTTSIFSIIIVVISTIFSAYGSLYLKIGSEKIKKNILKNYKLILGMFLFGITVPFYLVALKYGELNVLYPITSLSYVWAAILSIKHLKEKMNAWKYLGIGAIIIGMAFIGLGS